MVYEIDGTKIVDTYFKASQRPDDHQIRLYHGDAVFAGPYATYKYDLGADVVVANVFAAGMDGTTWKVELSEDGGKTWSDMSRSSKTTATAGFGDTTSASNTTPPKAVRAPAITSISTN